LAGSGKPGACVAKDVAPSRWSASHSLVLFSKGKERLVKIWALRGWGRPEPKLAAPVRVPTRHWGRPRHACQFRCRTELAVARMTTARHADRAQIPQSSDVTRCAKRRRARRRPGKCESDARSVRLRTKRLGSGYPFGGSTAPFLKPRGTLSNTSGWITRPPRRARGWRVAPTGPCRPARRCWPR
jgi:hypothetical protein